MLLEGDDTASEQRIVTPNLQLFNNSDLHRRFMKKKFDLKLELILELCATFFDNTEVNSHLFTLELPIY